MPERMLRPGIITSEAVNKLSFAAEVFYRRLMSIVDDYGRFDGRAAILRANLYPLKLGSVVEPDVEKWLAECAGAGLVRVYEVEQKRYVMVEKFDQRLRAKKSKWPAPANGLQSSAGIRPQMTANCGHSRESASETETETETETNSETQSESRARDSLPAGRPADPVLDRILQFDALVFQATRQTYRDSRLETKITSAAGGLNSINATLQEVEEFVKTRERATPADYFVERFEHWRFNRQNGKRSAVAYVGQSQNSHNSQKYEAGKIPDLPPEPEFFTRFRSEIQSRLGESSFATWVQPVRFLSLSDQVLTVWVPDLVFENYLLDNYREMLGEVLEAAGIEIERMEFQAGEIIGNKKENQVAGIAGAQSMAESVAA